VGCKEYNQSELWAGKKGQCMVWTKRNCEMREAENLGHRMAHTRAIQMKNVKKGDR
jgi:hypothetical protein